MPLLTRKVQSLDNVNTILRGGITATKSLDLRAGSGSQFKLFGLHGLTLIFTSPASETATFADAAGAGLDLKAIAAQIVAQTTGVVARFIREGDHTRLTLIEAAPASGVAISAAGTANPIFGFDIALATTGTVYGAPGETAPALASIGGSFGADSYLLVTDEA